MILAVQENLVPGDAVAAKLALALDAGFDGLELRDADPRRLPELAGLRGRVPSAGQITVAELSAVLGVHVGPGTLGIVVSPRT